MKKRLITLAMFLSISSITLFTGCGDEDTNSSSNTEQVTQAPVQTEPPVTEKTKLTYPDAQEAASNYVTATLEAIDAVNIVIGTVKYINFDVAGPIGNDGNDYFNIRVMGHCSVPDDYGHLINTDFNIQLLVNDETAECRVLNSEFT